GLLFREVPREERAPVVPPPDQPALSPIQQNHLWAFVVGINKYQSTNVPRLRFAVPDARAIRDRVVRRVPAAGIREAFLEDQEATRQRILDGFDRLAAAGPDDTVLIYLSMHGMTDRSGKEGFLVAHDTDPWAIESTGVPVNDMLGRVAKIPAKRVFIVIDTCYSGSVVGTWGAQTKTFNFGPQTRAAAPLSTEIYDAVKAQRGHFVVSASRPDETSLELESLGHGLFTYFLLEGLDGAAARPGNSYVSITDIYTYVSDRVALFAKNLNQKQTPMMHGNFDGAPPFVTVVGHATAPQRSELEKLIRETRLSYESSRIFVKAPKGDRVEMFVAGERRESWEGDKEVRLPKEIFDKHGNEVAVVVRASRRGKVVEEQTFKITRGAEHRVAIAPGEAIPRLQVLPPPPP
ncbi:MAG: caspase family protein, partial [Candidatus Rokuibacteriota bacterium]